MNVFTDKTPDKASSVTESNWGSERTGATPFQLAGNRTTAIQMRKLQAAMNNGPRVRQLLAIREVVNKHSAEQSPLIQKKTNQTGLPDNLKAGIETLSKYSMDDVNVHYNSNKPSQLQAHAYTQGTDIHLSPGQERHLPHEAWHVAQQKQGRVRPTIQAKGGVSINDDEGLEQEADLMGGRALQMVSVSNQTGRDTSTKRMNLPQGGESRQPIQRVVRDAKVKWAITHLVQVQGADQEASLFGNEDDWQSNEVSPEDGGQLTFGQSIVVDDELVFMSRRGPNQENPERRSRDKDDDALKYRWLQVLAIPGDEEFKPAPPDTFIRAETIELEKLPQKNIKLNVHGLEEQGVVSQDLESLHEAWQVAAGKRRRSIGHVNTDFEEDLYRESQEGLWTQFGDIDEEFQAGPGGDLFLTSGWNWDQFDEGENVSESMMNPGDRTGFAGDDSVKLKGQQVLSASYESGDGERIAYLVLEKRQDGDEPPYMYIRWLIGHPNKGGGGAVLMKEAIRQFKAQDECAELRVESAFSAVPWYLNQGFKKVNPDQNVVAKGVGYADTALVLRK